MADLYGEGSVALLEGIADPIGRWPETIASPSLPGTVSGRMASLAPQTQCLPHYPMILHRGGFPDGS